MTSNDFCYWLQGFFELAESDKLSTKQVQVIKDHLQLVFNKVTPDRHEQTESPPAIEESQKAALRERGEGALSGLRAEYEKYEADSRRSKYHVDPSELATMTDEQLESHVKSIAGDDPFRSLPEEDWGALQLALYQQRSRETVRKFKESFNKSSRGQFKTGLRERHCCHDVRYC